MSDHGTSKKVTKGIKVKIPGIAEFQWQVEENLSNVVNAIKRELGDDLVDPPSVSWQLRFARSATVVSEEDVQELLATIWVKEARCPNTVHPRLLRILEDMDRTDIQTFRHVARMALPVGLIEETIYSTRLPTFSTTSKEMMEEYGLVSTSTSTYTPPGRPRPGGMWYALGFADTEKTTSLQIWINSGQQLPLLMGRRLTPSGQSLAKLLQVEVWPTMLTMLAETLAKSKAELVVIPKDERGVYPFANGKRVVDAYPSVTITTDEG